MTASSENESTGKGRRPRHREEGSGVTRMELRFDEARDPGLHERLRKAAEAEDRSLHYLIMRVLREWAADHATGTGGQS